MIERFGFILARSKQSIQLFWIRTPTLDFLTNLKAIILLNLMTKGHKNFGAAGLHDFREKIKIKKKTNAREWLSFDIPTAKVTLHKMNFECMYTYSRQLKKSVTTYVLLLVKIKICTFKADLEEPLCTLVFYM